MPQCESRNPHEPGMRCTREAGHDELHVLGGIAWSGDEEPLTSLTLSRAEIGLAIDGVAMLVNRQDRTAAPLLHKLQSEYKRLRGA